VAASLPRRVLFVIDQLECGGAQQLLAPFTASLVRRGWEVTVCALQPGSELVPRMEAAGARVVLLDRPRPSVLQPRRMLGYVRANLRDIKRLSGPGAVISAHLSDAEFLGILAGVLQRDVRVQATVHTPGLLPSRGALDPRNVIRRGFTALVFNRADWIVAVSAEVADSLARDFGVRRSRLRVIHNGIDVDAFDISPPEELRQELGLPEGGAVFTSVARLHPAKHHEAAVRALARLVGEGRNVWLLLAGDGELRGMLEKLAREQGVGERVVFAGMRNDVPEILALSDCYIMPSVYEGTSLALLEAMAAGKPVVASRIPGIMHVVHHEENGLLAPPRDDAALAGCMARILDEPGLARRLARRGRRTVVEKYDIENMVDAYVELWNTSHH